MADGNFLETLMAVRDRAKKLETDFVEVRGFRGDTTMLLLQDGDIHKIDRNLELGACVRILVGDSWGFASANSTRRDVLLETLENAMNMAHSARRRGYNEGTVARAEPVTGVHLVSPKIDARSIPVERKCDFLTTMEREAVKAGEGKIVNTRFIYHDSTVTEFLVNSFGTEMENTLPRTHAIAVVTARDGDLRQEAYEARGEVGGYEIIEGIEPRTMRRPTPFKGGLRFLGERSVRPWRHRS
ncbi:MAG: PmbA/TldA family metallopeptidase [Planctomycetota bacterium]|jgi:predicted Zn-dependent protease